MEEAAEGRPRRAYKAAPAVAGPRGVQGYSGFSGASGFSGHGGGTRGPGRSSYLGFAGLNTPSSRPNTTSYHSLAQG